MVKSIEAQQASTAASAYLATKCMLVGVTLGGAAARHPWLPAGGAPTGGGPGGGAGRPGRREPGGGRAAHVGAAARRGRGAVRAAQPAVPRLRLLLPRAGLGGDPSRAAARLGRPVHGHRRHQRRPHLHDLRPGGKPAAPWNPVACAVTALHCSGLGGREGSGRAVAQLGSDIWRPGHGRICRLHNRFCMIRADNPRMGVSELHIVRCCDWPTMDTAPGRRRTPCATQTCSARRG